VRALDRPMAGGASGDGRTDADSMLERGHRLLLLVDALAKQVGQRAAERTGQSHAGRSQRSFAHPSRIPVEQRRQMRHAVTPAHSLAPVPKASAAFFKDNRRSCDDWLVRMRPPLVTAAWRLLPAGLSATWLASLALQRLQDLHGLLPTTSSSDGPRVVRDIGRAVQRLGMEQCCLPACQSCHR